MSARGPEPVAVFARLVRERPRVDDERRVSSPHLDREGVCVAVRREKRRAWRPAVESEPGRAPAWEEGGRVLANGNAGPHGGEGGLRGPPAPRGGGRGGGA